MKTNRLFIIFSLIGLLIGLSSCDDVVNIPASDRLTQEAIWSGDKAILDQYVIGLYGAVREKSTLLMLDSQYTDCMTDLLKDADWTQSRRYNRKMFNYEPFNSDDASILSNWSDSYARIRRFNEFLRSISTSFAFTAGWFSAKNTKARRLTTNRVSRKRSRGSG